MKLQSVLSTGCVLVEMLNQPLILVLLNLLSMTWMSWVRRSRTSSRLKKSRTIPINFALFTAFTVAGSKGRHRVETYQRR